MRMCEVRMNEFKVSATHFFSPIECLIEDVEGEASFLMRKNLLWY